MRAGYRSKQKGDQRERELAALVHGNRVLLSDAAGGGVNVDVQALGLTWEGKAHDDGFRQLYQWLEPRNALTLKADRRPWLVCMPLATLLASINSSKE
jgi:hypothetical protein